MRIRRAVLATVLAVACGAGARAQFDIHTWGLEKTESFSWGGGTYAASKMQVTGPIDTVDPCIGGGQTWFETTAPYGGTVVTRLAFSSDNAPGFDWPVHLVDGTATPHAEDCVDCEVVFQVPAGATFGLGVQSLDCVYGAGNATFTSYRFLPAAHVVTGPGSPGETRGVAVAALPDEDGDGVPDLLVGAPGHGSGTGRVYRLSGADLSVSAVVPAPVAGGAFGSSLGVLGDLDGDGLSEYAVGAPTAGAPGGPSATGAAYVYSGAGALLRALHGDATGDAFGSALAAAGDLDGDGHGDLAVGAPSAGVPGPLAGLVRVYAVGSPVVLLQVTGANAGHELGRALASAGDVDADGVPDLIAGAPGADDGAGRMLVLSGATGSVVLSRRGVAAGDRLGTSVAGPGDVNADGVPDVAVGAPRGDGPVPDVGTVWLVSGATGQTLLTWKGGMEGDALGASVASAGDADADGRPDLLIGAPGDPQGWHEPVPGSARVVSGRDGSLLHLIQGASLGDALGAAVAGAGDLDGDGRPELVAGAPFADVPGTDAGAVFTAAYTVPWADLGHGLPGALGTPALVGSGLLAPGSAVTLRLFRGPPSSTVTLVVGLSEVYAPFKSGTLVPQPDVLVGGLVVGPAGDLVLSSSWPAGAPSGTRLTMQAWSTLPGAVAASNAVRATVP